MISPAALTPSSARPLEQAGNRLLQAAWPSPQQSTSSTYTSEHNTETVRSNILLKTQVDTITTQGLHVY